jgi:DeoR/GlpR family transcriptional regulator of sugar metabolism
VADKKCRDKDKNEVEVMRQMMRAGRRKILIMPKFRD